jgi:outer membrane protein assembly factor BamB
VCITTYTGAVACVRQADGHLLWIHYFKRDAFRYDSFYASPSTDGTRVFAAGRSGTIRTLDGRTGQELWSYSTGAVVYGTPSTANGRVFVADLGGGVVALKVGNGERLWRTTVAGRVLGPTLVVGDLLFFSTLEGRTYAARVADGRIVWQTGLGKYAPGIATREHYYLSLNGLLVAYEGSRSKKR